MAKALDLFEYATDEATDITVGKMAKPSKKGEAPSAHRSRKQAKITARKTNVNRDYTADDI
ncbi:MAG: hypothetical protein VYE58_08205, partial [Pseudomonadota bacterium]|nr:hypothetical protein [Pseudomonadota bacterium]